MVALNDSIQPTTIEAPDARVGTGDWFGFSRRCPRCEEIKPHTDFRKNDKCYCRACRSALEKCYRQKPANKAKEREYQRAYMREKRFQCDDAIRAANYYGFAVVAWCVHAYIPTPVEELIYKEDLEEERRAAWPLIIRRSSLPNNPVSHGLSAAKDVAL